MGKHMSRFARAVFQFQANDQSVLQIRNNQTMPFFLMPNHANSDTTTHVSNTI